MPYIYGLSRDRLRNIGTHNSYLENPEFYLALR